VDTIHVVVGGEASNKLVRDSVVAMLRNVRDIEPHPLESDLDPYGPVDEVIARVNEHGAKVLIVVSDSSVSPDIFRRYWRNNTDLVVIGIESDGQETIIRLKKLGEDLLADLIRSVASAAETSLIEETEDKPTGSIHVFDSEKIRRLADQAGKRIPSPPVDIGSNEYRHHFDDVLHWVEVFLHRHLLVMAEAGDSQASTPGWTISPQKARHILGGEYEHANQRKLEREQVELEHLLSRQVSGAKGRSGLFAVYDAFGLDEAARNILWLCIAPEIDGRYATVFGVINDDLTHRRPTATTLAKLLFRSSKMAIDVLKMLDVAGPFARFRLVAPESGWLGPRSEAPISAAGEVIDFLCAAQDRKPSYPSWVRVENNADAPAFLGESTEHLRKKIAGWRTIGVSGDALAPLFQLKGGEETLRWFERAAHEARCPVVVFDVTTLGEQTPVAREQACMGACRVALMHLAALVVTGRDADSDGQRRMLDDNVLGVASTRVELLVVHGRPVGNARVGRSVYNLQRGSLGVADRAAIWRDRAHLRGITLPRILSEDIAATVRFEEPKIDATLDLCSGKHITVEQIKTAARRVAATSVPIGARRIEPCFSFDDLVISDEIKDELALIPQHVKYSRCVMEDWDFHSRMPYGHGVTALFSGPSGTGKTMASQIIANEIGVGCMRIDLSQCRSKWYGESEERIGEVFDAAEKSCSVLQIEEAEAMFRSRGSDHDRQGQSEVAFLLDRMESYSGVAILTTNLKEYIDTAFLRRIRFVINFPAPVYEQRVQLWKKVFPSTDLLARDISFEFLARRLELTGGHIQQIACRAAYLAAPTRSRISMDHIYIATRQELRKLGMQSAERKIAELAA